MRCISKNKNGTARCKNQALEGSSCCRVHQKVCSLAMKERGAKATTKSSRKVGAMTKHSKKVTFVETAMICTYNRKTGTKTCKRITL